MQDVQKKDLKNILREKIRKLVFLRLRILLEMRKPFSSDLGDLKSIMYTYDKVKIFSLPLIDHIVVLLPKVRRIQKILLRRL